MIAVNQESGKCFVLLHQLVCDSCFAFLIANIFEFRKNHLNDDSFFIFKCPKCGYESYVSKEMLDKSATPVRIHSH